MSKCICSNVGIYKMRNEAINGNSALVFCVCFGMRRLILYAELNIDVMQPVSHYEAIEGIIPRLRYTLMRYWRANSLAWRNYTTSHTAHGRSRNFSRIS